MLKKITVFGGSQTNPGDSAYHDAFLLGNYLAKSGFVVINGGYMGTMEAVSRGANEAGGQVIGITCEEIEAWRNVRHNQWITEEIRLPTLRERLNALIELCDGAFALPGGVGTLTEVSLMWNLLLTNSIPPKPLITIGLGWQTIINQFYNCFDSYIPGNQRNWISMVITVENAVSALQETLSSGKL